MCMIGKLGRDWKADWLKHLPTLVHAYNSTQLATTRYSPHYLMYRCWPHLAINFYFSTIRGMKKHQCVDHYIAELCEWLWEAFKEAEVQPHQRWRDRSGTVIEKLMPFHWNQVTWSWLKPMLTGEEESEGLWEEEPYDVEHQVVEGIPSYLMRNQQTGHSWVLHQNWPFLITPTWGTPLCMILHAKQAKCTTTTLEEQTLEKSETEKVPQSVNCLSPVQHQTGETPLGWVNRRLHAFIQMFPRASLLDQGWKVQCRGIMGVWKSISVFWWQK